MFFAHADVMTSEGLFFLKKKQLKGEKALSLNGFASVALENNLFSKEKQTEFA